MCSTVKGCRELMLVLEEKAAKIEKARRNNYLANEEAKRKHEEQIEKNKSNSPSANTTS